MLPTEPQTVVTGTTKLSESSDMRAMNRDPDRSTGFGVREPVPVRHQLAIPPRHRMHEQISRSSIVFDREITRPNAPVQFVRCAFYMSAEAQGVTPPVSGFGTPDASNLARTSSTQRSSQYSPLLTPVIEWGELAVLHPHLFHHGKFRWIGRHAEVDPVPEPSARISPPENLDEQKHEAHPVAPRVHEFDVVPTEPLVGHLHEERTVALL